VTLAEFRKQIASLEQLVTAMSVARVEEVVLAACQRQLLSLIATAERAGTSRTEVLKEVRGLTRTLVQLAERDRLTISHELEALVDTYAPPEQPPKRPASLPASKPLASLPREFPVRHTVFVDEAGTASFAEEHSQPVMCLVGVLVEDEQIERFDLAVKGLLLRYGIADDAEIHAQPLLSGDDPFHSLSQEQRNDLLKEFVSIGLRHTVGVHYLSMLKPLIKPGFRQKMETLGHDAYTSNVVHFVHLLRVAIFGKVGLIRYRYLFDDTPKYSPLIKRIFEALRHDPNPNLRLTSVVDAPEPVDSKDHRFVQLADVIGYFLVRYRQFEVKTYQPRENLRKHEAKYHEMHEIIRPHVMSYVADGLYKFLDMPAVQAWALPPRTKKNNKR
jgi:hypothetical protein